MKIQQKLTMAAAIATALCLAGCATLPGAAGGQYPSSPLAFTQPEAQQVQEVRVGRVLAVRSVEIAPSGTRTTIGSGIGALIGGLAGHQIGSGNGKTLATMAGAIGGAVTGNVATSHLNRQPGLAITVKVTSGWGSGAVEQITQAIAPGVSIAPGERVEIVGHGCGSWSSGCNDPARVIPLPTSQQ